MNRYVDLRHEGFRFGLLVVALRVALVIWPLHTCAEPGNQEHRSQSDFAIPAKVFDGCGIVVSSQAVGSGFWVASNRFVTCAHVIGEAKARISVHTRNGERYWPRVVRFFSVTDDVAVLELDSPHHTWLTLAGRADLNDPVCSVANSEGAEVLKLDYGKIISEGPRFIEISAKIKPGCSGGPIVSANGEVVGMSSFVRWENVAIREGRIVYDTRFDKARRFAVKAGLLHDAVQTSYNQPGISVARAASRYIEHKYGSTVVRLYDLVANPFAESLRTKLTFAHRYQKRPVATIGTPKGRLYHEGGEVVEDRFELIAGDTTPLRHVLPLSESLGEVIRELQSQTLASPRLQQILGDIELLSVEVRQYARDYLSIAGQPGRNSYKLTDVERRRGILTRKLRAVEQQVKTLRDGLREQPAHD